MLLYQHNSIGKAVGTPVRRGPNNEQSNHQMPFCNRESAPENTESDIIMCSLGMMVMGPGPITQS